MGKSGRAMRSDFFGGFPLDIGSLLESIVASGISTSTQMAAELNEEIELEVAHVLFLDIVAYSKLSVNAQVEEG